MTATDVTDAAAPAPGALSISDSAAAEPQPARASDLIGTTPPPRAGIDAWWTLTVVSTLYVASYLNRFIITMVVPDLKASLKITDLEMGIILGPAFAFS